MIRCFVRGSLTLGDPAERCFAFLCATNVPLVTCLITDGAEPIGLCVLLVTVALAGCFAGGSDQRADERPGVAALACVFDRVSDRAFGIRSRQDSPAKLGEHCWVAFVCR